MAMLNIENLINRGKEEGILFHSEILEFLERSDNDTVLIDEIVRELEARGVKIVDDINRPGISKEKLKAIEKRALDKLRRNDDDNDKSPDCV